MSQNRFALAAWIREFAQALAADPRGLLDHLSHEPPANEVRLIYSPQSPRQAGLSAEAEASSVVSSNVVSAKGVSGAASDASSFSSSSEEMPQALPEADRREPDVSVVFPDEGFSEKSRITSNPKTQPQALPSAKKAPKDSIGDTVSYPANFRCTLCEDRMYPVRRFYRKGRLPVLVAHHSGGFLGGTPKRDVSERFVLGSAEEDALFSRMLGALGRQLEDFHFQEYLACHFNPERSIDEDWTRRGQNCLNHLKDTIEREKIRLLLLTGPAAIILLSEDVAKRRSENGEPLDLPLGTGGQNIRTLPIRSPAALLALEAKRKAAQASGNETAYQKILSKEKKIKTQILSSLKRVLSEDLLSD